MGRRYKRPKGSYLVFWLLLVGSLYARCSHAGIISDACNRLMNKISMDDPYQYEFIASAWLEREADRLEIKQAWGRLEKEDVERLNNIKRELQVRANHSPQWQVGE